MPQCNEGTKELNRVVTILYVSLQISIALFISIIGAVHVRRCRYEQKIKIHTERAISLDTGDSPLFYITLSHHSYDID